MDHIAYFGSFICWYYDWIWHIYHYGTGAHIIFSHYPGVLFVGVIHWFGDIWKIVLFKKGTNWRLVLLFGIPGIVASIFGAKLSFLLSETTLKQLLGVFLLLYVAFLFSKPKWKISLLPFNALFGGALSGFFAGIFGVGGAVRSSFLTAYDLEKAVFIFTSGAIGFLIDSGRISQYVIGGTRLEGDLERLLIFCIPVSLLGAHLAKQFVDRIPQKMFRAFIALALCLVGIRYLVFG